MNTNYKIKSSKIGRVGNIFKIKTYLVGPKKAGQEASSIRDPTSSELIVATSEIEKVTLKYCVENLANNTP